MASSTKKQLVGPNLYNGETAAPPPTPSTQPNHHRSTSDSSAAAADVLSKLLHRLPPPLSLPTRLSPPPPPIISLSDSQNSSLLDNILSSASQLGYFQLTDHCIPPQLAGSAESDSLSLFNLTPEQKQLSFPKNWPLGFDGDSDGNGESFCLDSLCFTESTQLNLSSLREFTREMEKIGLEVIESLSSALGFENPLREEPTRACSLMWISEGCPCPSNLPVTLSRVYPYIIGLQYQITSRKYSLLADSGWVSVSPQVDSVLVTIGDIAQVWSNGKLKKVRGKPEANLGEDNKSRCITMSLLVTLPINSIVSPLLPRVVVAGDDDEEMLFKPFPFEDYAWRVYHQQVFFKDPLDRYRI